MKIERAGNVAAKYRQLVAKTCEIAGGHIRNAWKSDPITEDHQMNVSGGIDFSALEPFEKAYLNAVAQDLAWWRFWR
jgi:hypothetical protein